MSFAVAVSDNRFGRVGHNQRNLSNEVFNFGSDLLGSRGDNDRFKKLDSAAVERDRQHQERQKRLERDDFRRNWKSEIERSRWQKMAQDYDIKQECLNAKQTKARIGKNSVSYNPITLEYHKNSSGEALAREDTKAVLRTSIRSLNLYLKNNSFDPMRCQDVPKDVSTVFGVKDTAAQTQSATHQSLKSSTLTPPKYGRRSQPPVKANPDAASLDIPKALLNYTKSNVQLLKSTNDKSVGDILAYLRNDKERWSRYY